MLVSEFDYYLPQELIAKEPLPDRSASRMLHLQMGGAADDAALRDRVFRDLPDLLRADDLLVLNNTRVFPARLYGRRVGVRAQLVSPNNPAAAEFLQGRIEVLLTRQLSQEPNEWECLVHPGRKIGLGERLFFGEGAELQAEVIGRGGLDGRSFGERRIRFVPHPDFVDAIERIGHVPLPPYIDRLDRPADRDRYQTVYARESGSVAAPTAGLHFTPEIFGRLREKGIETAEITLHVGLGTFQPVRSERVEDHRLHREWYRISPEAAERISRAMASGRRIVAVGTTTVRTLEYAALQSGRIGIEPASGEAELFIYPGFRFQVVGALVTNFHLPKSTLLMLVSAFAGRGRVLAAYRHAIKNRYRFYSYGDCMFIE